MTHHDEPLRIGPVEFQSRLILGTGKYPNADLMVRALEASGCDCVTVAVRRIDMSGGTDWFERIDRRRYKILPNTAGCATVHEAVRTARLAREAGLSPMIKLEVIGDRETLYPDLTALVEATRILAREGFLVMPYTSDDLVTALRLEDAGAACVMPLGAPIGSGLGILNPLNIRMIIERVRVPVIVDAGVGTASDAAIAMELGADGVLMNTGVAEARDPVRMAHAMRLAVQAGRDAFLAGRIPKRTVASPSSPEGGRIGT